MPTPSGQQGKRWPIQRSSTCESDVTSYFHLRQTSRKDTNDCASTPASPRFWEGEVGPRSHKAFDISRQSGDSDSSIHETEQHSLKSPVSTSSKQPHNITDWNDKRLSDSVTNASNFYKNGTLDPPRPANIGMEWVWFPEGYWAEREILPAKKRQARIKRLLSRPTDQKATSSQPGSNHTTPPPKSIIPRIEIVRFKSDKSIPTAEINNHSSLEEKGDHDGNTISSLSSTMPRLGLSCRIKKTLTSPFAKSKMVTRHPDEVSKADLLSLLIIVPQETVGGHGRRCFLRVRVLI